MNLFNQVGNQANARSDGGASIFVSLYKHINRTGLLRLEWVQSGFVLSYFAYKKYLEDSTVKLVKNYPDFFCKGHILDIGANIGYTSYVFSKALTSPYQIFAFEPEERNVKILKKVAKTYKFSEKIIITAAAVGDKEGEIELWQNDDHPADHRVLTEEFRKQLPGNIQIQKIPLVTIDHFLKKRDAISTVSFIKIDVQGFELAVCKGMEETLAANPNCVVWFEYCPSIMLTLGYQAKDLLQFFQNKNFFFYQLNKQGKLVLLDLQKDERFNCEKNFAGYFDILCSQNLI